MLIILYV